VRIKAGPFVGYIAGRPPLYYSKWSLFDKVEMLDTGSEAYIEADRALDDLLLPGGVYGATKREDGSGWVSSGGKTHLCVKNLCVNGECLMLKIHHAKGGTCDAS